MRIHAIRSMLVLGTSAVVALSCNVSAAHATASTAVTDAQTHQVGSALATCLTGLGDNVGLQQAIYHPALGKGAVLAQAYFPGNVGAEMANRLGAGQSPHDILTAYKAANATQVEPRDPNLVPLFETAETQGAKMAARRQYLVTSFSSSEGYTGSQRDGFGAPDAQGTQSVQNGDFTGIVGGNTLTDGYAGNADSVFVDRMRDSFTAQTDIVTVFQHVLGDKISDSDAATLRNGDPALWGLSDKLFLTLAAGFARDANGNLHGDMRCVTGPLSTPFPRSSSRSWLRVDNPNETLDANGYPVNPPINIKVRSLHNVDGFVQLARMYKACRLGTGPCTGTDANFDDASAAGYAGGVNGTMFRVAKFGARQDVRVSSIDKDKLKGIGILPNVEPASLEVRSCATQDPACDVTVALPAISWRNNRGRYLYSNHATAISSVSIDTNSGRLELEGIGNFMSLNTRPAAVDVIFRSGLSVICMHFPGTAAQFNAGKYFRVLNAARPTGCAS
jgi:hypothetical protein